MRKINRKQEREKVKKQTFTYWHLVFFLLSYLGIGLLVSGTRENSFVSSVRTFAESILICPSPQPGKKTLQLATCYLATSAPTGIISPLPTVLPTNTIPTQALPSL